MKDTVKVRRLRPFEKIKLRRMKRRRRNAVNSRNARIVLMSSGHVSNAAIAKMVDCTPTWVRQVIHRFNARMRAPLVPTVRGIYADGDTVIILFDASATAADGLPYRNTYTWYFMMTDGKVTKAIAFFDTREFDEFWHRVNPK